MNKQKVALVLSTGGARGIAHIGVIEELERQGYEISSIAGCSMGALVGAAYATGNLQKCKEALCELDLRRIWRLLDISFSKKGFLKGDKILKELERIMPDLNIEELPLPYAAVATNLLTDSEVVFEQGSLYEAVRASISLPLVFKPVEKEGMLLVDGGISNPLPLSRVKRTEGDLLVAVIAGAPEERTSGNPRLLTNNKYSLLIESLTTLVQRLIGCSVSAWQPDIVIRVPGRKYSLLQFNKAVGMIEEGAEATRRALQKVEELKK